ncbi:uncharacterized protein LOC125035899 [Penaeus chinensis]|uniref:uncharacterized protein LOC125035899 n=1 Tax=Penaeus chinensis TaxID=139456 RepID=UPI001FB6CF31|nr:uncharacterized protein LOC125035899 [Penaeus chinensis]
MNLLVLSPRRVIMSPSLASVAAAVAVMLAVASEGRPRTIVDYNAGSHSRRESGLPGVAVEGEYRWRTPNGQENVVRYTADKNGYVARGNVVPGHYDPLGNPRLVQNYYLTPLEASAEAPAQGPSEAAEAGNDHVLMTTVEDAEDSPVEEGTDDAIDEKINEILVEKAAEDVPAEEVAEDTSGGDAAEDVSDKEIADDAPAEEVAADASNKEAAEDVPADDVDEDRDADTNISDDAQTEAADEVDSTRAEKAVPAAEMAGMNAIIFPDDPSPSVPFVEAVEGMPEAEANGMNAIIFPDDVPVGEMTEPELSTEDAPAVEMEDQPDMNIIPATEMSVGEESGAPEIAVPDDSATDESAAEEGLLATEAPEEMTAVHLVSGQIILDPVGVWVCWADYFDQLYQVNPPPTNLDAGTVEILSLSHPSARIHPPNSSWGIISKLKSGKASDNCGIPAELLKVGGKPMARGAKSQVII